MLRCCEGLGKVSDMNEHLGRWKHGINVQYLYDMGTGTPSQGWQNKGFNLFVLNKFLVLIWTSDKNKLKN